MKNTPLILSIVSLVAVVALGIVILVGGPKKAEPAIEGNSAEAVAEKGAIVYIDLDRIVTEYDMANDLRSAVETKVKNIEAEVTRKGKKLEKDITTFQDKVNKGLMTRSVAETQSKKLQQQELEFNNYAAQKQQEIQEEQMVMMNQILDAIHTYVSNYNEEKQYAMILVNNGGAPVLTADPALDVTEEILTGLNEEYIESKNAENK